MRVGVFGGTFDPPHLGHLILAAEACDQLKLERLLWVLTAQPPHKQNQPIRPVEVRMELLQAALKGDSRFEVSRVDIDRPGPHYALDTLRLLQEQMPQAQLFYLMGGDSLHDLPIWHEPQQFLDSCAGLGVMRRPGSRIDLAEIEKFLPGISSCVTFIDAPLLEISSQEIRRRIAGGHTFRYYLPTAVYELIQKQHLYRD